MITLTKQMIITLMALPNNDFCVQVSEPSYKRIVLREQIVSRRSRPQGVTIDLLHTSLSVKQMLTKTSTCQHWNIILQFVDRASCNDSL
jgi:hypothetical protein